MTASADELLFEAVIVPHRSLSRRGMATLIGALCSISFATGTLFWLLGAWPIIGFNGGEIALAVALLRLNARARRAREVVALTTAGLRITRTDLHGRTNERLLSCAWLTTRLHESPGRIPSLWLVARGEREEIGRALGEAEKRDLAGALRAALHRVQNPVFDNPQLREDPEPTGA